MNEENNEVTSDVEVGNAELYREEPSYNEDEMSMEGRDE